MIRPAIIPAFLLACLLLGGASAEGYAANLLLQLVALPVIALALLMRRADSLPGGARSLLTISGLLALAMLLQLIPLPPALWTILPGRHAIAEGYRLLDVPLPWLPLSLAPEATLAALLWLLPAFAVLLGMVQLGMFRPSWIAWAVVTAAALGVAVGALQVLGGDNSPWYFYDITNNGRAVGFFANKNHAATLLVTAIPFAAALQARALSRDRSRRQVPTILVITSAILVVVAVGLVINFSLAGLGLGVPVAVASLLLLRSTPGPRLTLGLSVTGVLIVAGIGLILFGPLHHNLIGKASEGLDLEQLTRRVSISTTLKASMHYLPVGSGVGTFREIYQQMEDPRETINTYMNHAHCDVAEIVLETGVPGILLMILAVAWWARRAIALWRVAEPDHFARAAAIASGAIMAHSFVDYPLRTAAISALFAACLALMSEVRPFVRAHSDGHDVRHVRVA